MGDGTPQNRDWKAARPSCQRLRGRGGEKSLEDKRNRDWKAAGPFSQQLRGRGGEKSLEDKRNKNRKAAGPSCDSVEEEEKSLSLLI